MFYSNLHENETVGETYFVGNVSKQSIFEDTVLHRDEKIWAKYVKMLFKVAKACQNLFLAIIKAG